MKTAADVMEKVPFTVTSLTPVAEVAKLLHDNHLDGVCVVDDEKLVGVITSMDLMFREKRVHLPTFFYFMDVAIPLENPFRSTEEAKKITAIVAQDMMTSSPKVAQPATALDLIASWMIEDHYSLIPVVEQNELIGIISKPAILREAFGL